MEGNSKIMRIIPVALLILLCSCGTTKISCPDPSADIFMDNSYLGKGEVKINSMGMPKTATLEARKNGQVIGQTTMSRQFTWGTFFLGIPTYYTGWLLCWYYPDEVVIPVPRYYYEGRGETKSPWDVGNDESVWMKPMQSKR